MKNKLKCPICFQYKEINKDYHKLQIIANNDINKIKEERVITEACNQCLDIDRNIQLRKRKKGCSYSLVYDIINEEELENKKIQNQLKILNVKFEDLLGLRETAEYLGENGFTASDNYKIVRKTLRTYQKRKLVDPITIFMGGPNSHNGYQIFYKKSELDNLIKLKENGEFVAFHNINTEYEHKLPDLIKKQWIFPPENDDTTFWTYVDNKNKKKLCKECLEILDFDAFGYLNNSKKDKLRSNCITCGHKRQNLIYKKLDPKQKEIYLQMVAKWKKENPNKIKNHYKKYASKIENKIKKSLRNRVSALVQNCDIRSNEIDPTIGCTPLELKEYLESKFKPGMTWENYGGNDYTKPHWHIDHIFPISKFINWHASEEDIKRQLKLVAPNHYTNLQPLWWKENMEKSNRVDYEYYS